MIIVPEREVPEPKGRFGEAPKVAFDILKRGGECFVRVGR
jgi:hypothetical protein